MMTSGFTMPSFLMASAAPAATSTIAPSCSKVRFTRASGLSSTKRTYMPRNVGTLATASALALDERLAQVALHDYPHLLVPACGSQLADDTRYADPGMPHTA